MDHSPIFYKVSEAGMAGAHLSEDVRRLSVGGRAAYRCTSRHGQIELPKHPFAPTRGHIALWFSPTEDLGQHPMLWRTWASNGVGHVVPLVSDYPGGPELEPACFGVFWLPHWGHPMLAKFAEGDHYPGLFHPQPKHLIETGSGCDELRRGLWYRLDLSFDHEAGEHALYLNGILAGRSDRFRRGPVGYDPCGERLFLRSPQIAYGDVTLYPEPLEAAAVAAAYAAEAPSENRKMDAELRRALTGEGNPRLDLKPEGDGWTSALELDLCDASQSAHFQAQGMDDALHWEPEGLRMATPQDGPAIWTGEGEDKRQVYLWSKKMFEGDLYIRYQFMPLQPGGLSLLITRATGMQGEDFMADYPLRTDGAMKTIHTSDIRMYHWEYHREMLDARNDVPTHAIVKWPWERVLATGISSSPIRQGEWNTLEFRQTGERVLGTINGELVIEGTDPSFAGHGPTLLDGHIAIRCMVRTEMRFRDLSVQTRPAR